MTKCDDSLIDILESLKLSVGSRKREGINIGLSMAQTVIRQRSSTPDSEILERILKAVFETWDESHPNWRYEKFKAAIAAMEIDANSQVCEQAEGECIQSDVVERVANAIKSAWLRSKDIGANPGVSWLDLAQEAITAMGGSSATIAPVQTETVESATPATDHDVYAVRRAMHRPIMGDASTRKDEEAQANLSTSSTTTEQVQSDTKLNISSEISDDRDFSLIGAFSKKKIEPDDKKEIARLRCELAAALLSAKAWEEKAMKPVSGEPEVFTKARDEMLEGWEKYEQPDDVRTKILSLLCDIHQHRTDRSMSDYADTILNMVRPIMREIVDEVEKCEGGCSEPVAGTDSEGIPLCQGCLDMLRKEALSKIEGGKP